MDRKIINQTLTEWGISPREYEQRCIHELIQTPFDISKDKTSLDIVVLMKGGRPGVKRDFVADSGKHGYVLYIKEEDPGFLERMKKEAFYP